MKEIRLTLNADDFGTISQLLIDMGMSFRVEPLEDAAAQATTTRPAPSTASPRRQTPKKAGKARAKRPRKRDEVPLSAADRLRKAIAQKQAASASTSPLAQPPVQQAPPTHGAASSSEESV
jgi:hypothetical protein